MFNKVHIATSNKNNIVWLARISGYKYTCLPQLAQEYSQACGKLRGCVNYALSTCDIQYT